MNTRWARVVRGCVAAAISLFVAAFLHIASGGQTPTMFALGASFVVSSFVCVALAGKRLSLPKLSVSVALSQFLFHGVFSVWTTEPGGVSQLGHVHEQAFVFAASGVPAVHSDAAMWWAHAIAAVVTIAALRHGESALRGMLELGRLWIGSFFAKLDLVRPTGTPHPAQPIERILPLRDLVLRHSSSLHRGPPAGFAALASA